MDAWPVKIVEKKEEVEVEKRSRTETGEIHCLYLRLYICFIWPFFTIFLERSLHDYTKLIRMSIRQFLRGLID